jgi:ComF family protein
MTPEPAAENTGTDGIAAALRRVGRGILDAALPPHCGHCGCEVDAPATLCPDCWSQVSFIADPVCVRCGCPLELDFGDALTCLSCAERPPGFRRARACVVYDDVSRSLILKLKHGDRHDLVALLANWMVRAGAALWAEADVLVPVPLHWTRLWTRRFNQSALIARAVGRRVDTPVLVDAVRRVRRTPSQGGLGRRQRLRNVRHAFWVSPKALGALDGKTVVVVDDVLTTGATLSAVAEALYAAGAAHVDAVTVARVEAPPDTLG